MGRTGLKGLVLLAVLASVMVSVAVAQDATPVGRVANVFGGGVVVRDGVSEPLAAGADLYEGDFLDLDDISIVEVTCNADGRRDIIDVDRSAGCAGSSGSGSLVVVVRGVPVVDTNLRGILPDPYILTPRNTRLLDTSPEFRWSAYVPEDASQAPVTYKVILSLVDGTPVWTVDNLTTNVLPYPAAQPFLRALDPAGTPLSYLVRVEVYSTGGNYIDTRLDTRNREPITIAMPEERQVIEAILADMGAKIADPVMLAYSQARYLSRSGYQYDAMALIEPLLTEDDQPDESGMMPALYSLAGDIYARISLPDEARTSYTHVLTLGEALNDLRIQADAQVALADMSGSRDAEALLNHALELYTQLGDLEAVAVITQRISGET